MRSDLKGLIIKEKEAIIIGYEILKQRINSYVRIYQQNQIPNVLFGWGYLLRGRIEYLYFIYYSKLAFCISQVLRLRHSYLLYVANMSHWLIQ